MLTVGASILTAEGSHVLREGVRQQQADVHDGAPLHCQGTEGTMSMCGCTRGQVNVFVHDMYTGGLTGAGEEVPAAEQVVSRGSQQILGTAQSPETKVPEGETKSRQFPWTQQHTYFTGLAFQDFLHFEGFEWEQASLEV